MKNQFRIAGDTTYILITRRNLEQVEFAIDTADLPKFQDVQSWRVITGRGMSYVAGHMGRKRVPVPYTIFASHLVLKPRYDQMVTFLDHDQLNLRRSNLALVAGQLELPKDKPRKQKSGYRYVYGYPGSPGYYYVEMRFRGKRYYSGKLSSLEVAITYRDGISKIIEELRKFHRGILRALVE